MQLTFSQSIETIMGSRINKKNLTRIVEETGKGKIFLVVANPYESGRGKLSPNHFIEASNYAIRQRMAVERVEKALIDCGADPDQVGSAFDVPRIRKLHRDTGILPLHLGITYIYVASVRGETVEIERMFVEREMF
jgi:hypothetical protein